MAEKTKIQWTDATINFWTGCIKVSEGCKYCYMYRDKDRYGQDATKVVRVSDRTVNGTLKKLTEPSKIFTCSWSDFFIEEADEWRPWAWQIIKDNPQHQWQILTKRPERIMQCLPPDWDDGYDNVWLGISAENQANYDERIGLLCNVPAKTKFLSLEPLIGPINMYLEVHNKPMKIIDWVIVGGESGNEEGKWRYRNCELEWIKDIVLQCFNHNTKLFVKQLGTGLAKQMKLEDRTGGKLKEWPMIIQVRQFP